MLLLESSLEGLLCLDYFDLILHLRLLNPFGGSNFIRLLLLLVVLALLLDSIKLFLLSGLLHLLSSLPASLLLLHLCIPAIISLLLLLGLPHTFLFLLLLFPRFLSPLSFVLPSNSPSSPFTLALGSDLGEYLLQYF